MASLLKGNAVVAQSGGPTAVINNSVCGVVRQWLGENGPGTLYGALFGIRGVLEENLLDMGKQKEEVIGALRHTPGVALGSSRYKLKTEEDYERLLEAFRKHEIRYFFYIGGNDSMDTADKINALAHKDNYEMRVIGIPKTIDNDLPFTDHCPGYGSAAKYLAATVLETGLDLKGLITGNRIVVLEAMGRNAGWLTAAAALAKRAGDDAPHLIYPPEIPFNREKFVGQVKQVFKAYGYVYIVASEGLRDEKGEYIFAGGQTDAFGHARLGGLADTLKALLEDETGINVRTIILATAQRAAMHYASRTDADEAYMAGTAAVSASLSGGESGKMITLVREGDGDAYRCSTGTVELSQAANVEHKLPAEWIDRENSYISEEFIRYARPLIEGEVTVPAAGGLPRYAHLDGFDMSTLRRKLDRQ